MKTQFYSLLPKFAQTPVWSHAYGRMNSIPGVTVKPFGADFLETLKSVEVAESDPLA